MQKTIKSWRDNLPEPKDDFFHVGDGESKEITFKDEGTEATDNFNNKVVRFSVEHGGKVQSWDITQVNPLLKELSELGEPLEGRAFLVSRTGLLKNTRYTISEIEK